MSERKIPRLSQVGRAALSAPIIGEENRFDPLNRAEQLKRISSNARTSANLQTFRNQIDTLSAFTHSKCYSIKVICAIRRAGKARVGTIIE